MKTILAVMLFGLPMGLPMVAHADYIDFFEIKLTDACKVSREVQIARDIDTWAAKYGYSTELWIPIEAPSPHLGSVYWVARIKDMATFGKLVDSFASEAQDADSVAGKLLARLSECEMVLSRSGYTTRK